MCRNRILIGERAFNSETRGSPELAACAWQLRGSERACEQTKSLLSHTEVATRPEACTKWRLRINVNMLALLQVVLAMLFTVRLLSQASPNRAEHHRPNSTTRPATDGSLTRRRDWTSFFSPETRHLIVPWYLLKIIIKPCDTFDTFDTFDTLDSGVNSMSLHRSAVVISATRRANLSEQPPTLQLGPP